MAHKPKEVNMISWGKGLESAGVENTSMVNALKRDKFYGWKKLEELNLPRYELKTAALTDFLKDAPGMLPTDKNKDWFVLLEPRKGGMRHRKRNLKSDGIMDFINKTINENNLEINNYDVAISESLPQEYGGNIIIDKEGKILVEVSKGGQGVVSEGSHDEEKHGKLFTVRRDQFTDSFKYSWKDGEETDGVALREAVNKTIMSIPHEGEGREMKFTPGYYEFHLVKKDDKQDLEPIFVDCREDESLASLPSNI
ncbi:MAG: hypothetical protein HYT15_04735 [Candidatus Magasanikbacteria bacterium]|nr:hypothetical protein [Candidatus Magasanikbacteria bacterium]